MLMSRAYALSQTEACQNIDAYRVFNKQVTEATRYSIFSTIFFIGSIKLRYPSYHHYFLHQRKFIENVIDSFLLFCTKMLWNISKDAHKEQFDYISGAVTGGRFLAKDLLMGSLKGCVSIWLIVLYSLCFKINEHHTITITVVNGIARSSAKN